MANHVTFERPNDDGTVDIVAVCTDPECKCVGSWTVAQSVQPTPGAIQAVNPYDYSCKIRDRAIAQAEGRE
jgi:hypothetical protein